MASADQIFLRFDRVGKLFGDVVAVDEVTIDIAPGEFVALVGTSGAGKSTLLKMVNRLEEPDSGAVVLEGRPVADMPAAALRRSIGYVFQQIGLFPHMSVAANIGIGPRLAGTPLASTRIAELLDLVELDGSHAARMPDALSGGQRQRVGLARALAIKPRLLLLDEPFGALDPVTRDALGEKVRRLHDNLGLTSIMVTHDMAEALLLADRVVVMERGRVVADEAPARLLAGAGGPEAQALVEVPRHQARRLADLDG